MRVDRIRTPGQFNDAPPDTCRFRRVYEGPSIDMHGERVWDGLDVCIEHGERFHREVFRDRDMAARWADCEI